MVVGERAVLAEDEDAVVVERRRAVATSQGELYADDRLSEAFVPGHALQLQPKVRPDTESAQIRLQQLIHSGIRLPAREPRMSREPQVRRRRLVRHPLIQRAGVENLSPDKLVDHPVVLTAAVELLNMFEVG